MAENQEEGTKWLTNNFPDATSAKGRDAVARVLKNPVARAMVREERHKQKELRESVVIDSLTGAYNRSYFEGQLQTAFNTVAGTVAHEKRRPHKTGLSEEIGLLMFDLDNFKDVNDTYGHNEGDAVLKRFAKVMKRAIREEDVFARWGGEEFMLLIKESNKLTSEEIKGMVERFRKAIQDEVFAKAQDGSTRPVTTSIGLALFDGVDKHRTIVAPEELISFADQAMFMAKAGGRNQAWEFDGLGNNLIFGKPRFSKISSDKPQPAVLSSQG